MNIHVFGKERSVKKMEWIAVSPKTGEGSKDFPGWVFTCNPAKVNWPHSKALMYKLDEEIVISKGEIKGKFKSDLIENQNLFDKFLKKIEYNEIRGFENTMTEFIIAPVKNPVDVLSDREFEVFMSLAKGQTTNEIADILSLSPRTVGTHLYNIKQKLNANNSAEIALIAMRSGLIDP